MFGWLTVAGWSPTLAQTSLFDQPLSPATPPSALPAPEPGAPPARPAPATRNTGPKAAASANVAAPAKTPVAAKTPVPTKTPAAAKVPAPVIAEAPAAAAMGDATAPAKPKPKPKPKAAAPSRSISVSNDSTNALTALEVTGDEQVTRLAASLAPGEKTQLKLPALKSCIVSVAATFAGAGSADTSEFNICKDKTLRFTD